MDSLTQATLGAAVGHLCWQNQLGRKALVLGAVIGTIPDLDILLYPFLDEVQRLYWHRGESHSVWFVVLGSLFCAWLLTRRTPLGRQLSMRQAGIGAFFIFSTHILIDLFTVYGTQLLAPISRKGFSLDNIYIIDPVFTTALLGGTVGAYLVKNRVSAGRLNQSFLFLASLYVVWSLTAQSIADNTFRRALAEKNIEVSRQITSSGPFTTLLWRHIAETPEGFVLAYWSLLDGNNRRIGFQHIPKNKEIVEQINWTRSFQAVQWFSKGWWAVVESDGTQAKVVDLRFSEIPSARNQAAAQWQWPFAWSFSLSPEDDTHLKPVRPTLKDPATTFTLLWQRIQGQDGWLTSLGE
jgi:inner membrane protein